MTSLAHISVMLFLKERAVVLSSSSKKRLAEYREAGPSTQQQQQQQQHLMKCDVGVYGVVVVELQPLHYTPVKQASIETPPTGEE